MGRWWLKIGYSHILVAVIPRYFKQLPEVYPEAPEEGGGSQGHGHG